MTGGGFIRHLPGVSLAGDSAVVQESPDDAEFSCRGRIFLAFAGRARNKPLQTYPNIIRTTLAIQCSRSLVRCALFWRLVVVPLAVAVSLLGFFRLFKGGRARG